MGRLFERPHRRVVLVYHSIHPSSWDFSSPPELFESHLEWLRDECEVVPLRDLIASRSGEPPAKPLVALTFDDGYEDNHAHAMPLLARHGLPATFFVTAGLIDGDRDVRERFGTIVRRDPGDLRFMSWSQLREMTSAGMEIGNHTYSHRNLARLAPAEVDEEVGRARSLLSEHLGTDVDLFAYPFGRPRVHFTPSVERIVEQHGHAIGLAAMYRQVRASDPLLRIPRFFVDGDDVERLRDKVLGAYDVVGWWQEHTPLWMVRLVSPELGRRSPAGA